jgi:chemosensory pili system protein ChpA (sensor histidine kinase/response regulator)
MSKLNESALVWIGDEVCATLGALKSELESLPKISSAERSVALASSLEKTRSIVGAFNVANYESLSLFASTLQSLIQLWRDSPSSLLPGSVATAAIASQNLSDFLQTIHAQKAVSELSLFDDYQRLGAALSRDVSPRDLWPQAEVSRCMQVWSLMEFESEQTYPSTDAEKIEVEVLMLGLMKHQQQGAGQALETYSAWRGTQYGSAQDTVLAILLSAILAAVSQKQLTLDLHLKRYLLSSLSWLKGRGHSDAFVSESVFFGFLAWQADVVSPSLASMAHAAQWQALKGTNYNQIYFDPRAKELLAKAQTTTTTTQQIWSDFCSPNSTNSGQIKAIDLAMSFDKMGQSLEALHPAAQNLSQAFHVVVSDTKLCTKREVQVEVATLLLILSSMLTDMKGRDDTQTESRFADLTSRLDRLRHGQNLGAYESWMLELQQRQDLELAMQSTTAALGQKLTEIEGVLEHYWSKPQDTFDTHANETLIQVPSKLQQVSAIASSLELDVFADSVTAVEKKISHLIQSGQMLNASTQKELASDLAGLGLMLSTWAHRPAMLHLSASSSEDKAAQAASVSASHSMEVAQGQDESIAHIFLMESQEVLKQAQIDLAHLSQQPEHIESLIAIRRAFHTLKGSARVVGLVDFGEAAWLMEQYLNDKLAEEQTLTESAHQLCQQQIMRMQDWTVYLLSEQSKADALLYTANIDWQLDSLRAQLLALEPASHASTSQASVHFDLPPANFFDLPVEPEENIDAQSKTIGDLQISIPLYQAYLNETDEWSRQLALALSEWALDETQAFPSQTISWAHSLAGSSATVGFESCAQLAKMTESLLVKASTQDVHSVDIAQTLSYAADEIRHLLHQFAAGFIKASDAVLVEKLRGYLAEDISLVSAPSVHEPTSLPLQVPSAPLVDTELKAVFEEESAQLIPELGAALRKWDKAQVLRTLHTLKGSARLVGEQLLAERAHDLESQIEFLTDQPTAEQLASLLQAYDQMVTPSEKQDSSSAQEIVQAAVQSVQAKPFVAAPSGETIRVQSSTVDRLVNQTGELMIARSRMDVEMTRSLRTLSDMGLQVQRLRDQLREMELQTESQLQSRQAQVSDAADSFDPLELDRFTRTQELTRFMAEALSDISTLQRSLQRSLNTTEDDLAAQLRQTRDLQRNLLRTRMVEFDSAAERLHRLVRMTSAELGKTIELTIQNGGQEMDRSVLERMLPVFEHLLRNAVVHGIELPADREAKGKPAQGQITIQLSQQSNDVIVSLQDDGRGIDHQALLQKARERTGKKDLNADPAELIFMSGLSTASEVSELAGRGIGMDVVRSQVFALGGRIEVGSTDGSGTSFKLILPLTTAVTQIVLVRTGSQLTGIPGNLVTTIVRVKPQDILDAYEKKSFVYAEQAYPFHSLSQLLQYKTSQTVIEQPTQNVMLLQSAGQTIALFVDEVIGNQEVMVKNLGVQLAQMPGLSGMTVLPTGPTVLIYNPVALAAIYGSLDVNPAAKVLAEPLENSAEPSTDSNANQAPLVMVVDDSITMRRVLQRLLQREGYRVAVAADGRQALDTLRLERPALVLSDVEMPRMDGFELLSSIRNTAQLATLPVVMITSRIADKHREHAKTLGANEYLGKPYSEDELLAVLARYAAK